MKSKHRTSSLKQVNKKHKTKFRITNSVEQGRVGKGNEKNKKTKIMSKKQRKQQAKQIKLQKNKELMQIVQSRGGKDSAPLLIALVPLSASVSPHLALTLLKSGDPDANLLSSPTAIPNQATEIVTISAKRLKKRVSMVTGRFGDMFGCLDLVKVADCVLLLCPDDISFEDTFVQQFLTCLYGQGVQSVCYGLMSNIVDIKEINAMIQHRYAAADVRRLNNSSDAATLLRHLCLSAGANHHTTATASVFRQRSSLIVEQMQILPDDSGNVALLSVTGCVRGPPLNVNDTVHLTGWADFNILRLVNPDDGTTVAQGNPSLHKEELGLEDNDQELGSDDDDQDMSDEDEDDCDISDELMETVTDLAASDENGSESEEGSCDDPDRRVRFASGTKTEDACSIATTSGGFSTAQLAKFRDARSEEQFPDEVETPIGMPARHRFAKYRGLAGFQSSEWSKDEDIPVDYRKIHKFKNYRHDRNRLVKQLARKSSRLIEETDMIGCVKAGSRITLHLVEPWVGAAKQIVDLHQKTRQPLLAFSLLKFENRMSVVHMTMRRLATSRVALGDVTSPLATTDKNMSSADDLVSNSCYTRAANLPMEAEPIKSKEPMMFQVGFRRFIAEPIYSEFSPGADKHKMLRYFPANVSACIVSMFAPVMYNPLPVLQFRVRGRDDPEVEEHLGELVATGSLLSVDPDRIILKRILLSGHPFKINKRSCVVRFMFFNPDDIDYFKPIELRSKWGRRGMIREAVGTHGYMKCFFDKQLTASDVALLPLYKRVFPKWHFHSNTALTMTSADNLLPTVKDQIMENAMEIFDN